MNDGLKQAVGAALRAARKTARLSQEELAHRIGRTPESVSNIERVQQLPSLETLIDLSRALDVPVSKLITEGEAQSSQSQERLRLEAQMHEIARRLSDRDLRIALAQVEILLNQV